MTHGTISRRTAMGAMAGLAGAGMMAPLSLAQAAPAEGGGRLKQSVSRWCYGKMKFEDLCTQAKAIGLKGIDLLDEPDWDVAIAHGLEVAMPNGPGGIAKGWNDPANHEELCKKSLEIIPKLSQRGIKNMIVLSGNRFGRSDAEGLENCVIGLRQILPAAEKANITIVMELLNSKRDHKDYMADHTTWGVALCDKLGSKNFKLLYDIYHMQIMEGDVIATIREFHSYIAHFHTGGVPGRHEIDQTQELNYRRICEAIVETGFQGFLAHEFMPKGDPMTSLRAAYEICNV
jgi:hydroxypyruvate isomerase